MSGSSRENTGREMLRNLRKQYKQPPATFNNVTKLKSDLVRELEEGRKKRRAQNFEENRKNLTMPRNDERAKKLLEWKAEREKRKKMEMSRKKPPFKVGIVRHHVYSPIATTRNPVEIAKRKKVTQVHEKSANRSRKGITRTTERRLLAKRQLANAAKRAAPLTATAKVSTDGESECNNFLAGLPSLSLFGGNFARDNHESNFVDRARNIDADVQGVIRCDSIETVALRVSSEEETSDSTREKQTNGSTLNRNAQSSDDDGGKRRENDCSDLRKDATTKRIDALTEEEKRDIDYFKRVLREEEERLRKLCEKWMEIQSLGDTAEDAYHRINQAVGQTHLLITQKFNQFRDLVRDCEDGNGDVSITCTDLHGFWDTMYIEVKNCASRFAKLERLRARHWQEERPPRSFVESIAKRKTSAKRQIERPVKRSSSRAFVSRDKREKNVTKIPSNREASRQSMNLSGKCVTPSSSDNRAANPFADNLDATHIRSFERSRNIVYTSTPLDDGVRSGISNQCNTSLLTMKVSQFYNKPLRQSRHATPDTSSRAVEADLVGKLKRSGRRNLGMRSSREVNDCLIFTKSLGQAVGTDESTETLSEKVNGRDVSELNSNDRVRSARRLPSGDSFVGNSHRLIETVIETTIKCEEGDDTLEASQRDINLIGTPLESKRSLKSLRTLARNLRHRIINEDARTPRGSPPSASRNARSSIRENRDAAPKATRDTTGESEESTSVRRLRSRSVITYDTPKFSKAQDDKV